MLQSWLEGQDFFIRMRSCWPIKPEAPIPEETLGQSGFQLKQGMLILGYLGDTRWQDHYLGTKEASSGTKETLVLQQQGDVTITRS